MRHRSSPVSQILNPPRSKRTKGHASLRVTPFFREGYSIPPKMTEGGRGGDLLLQEQSISPQPPKENWQCNTSQEQGAASTVIGIAANYSVASGEKVVINESYPLQPYAKKLGKLP